MVAVLVRTEASEADCEAWGLALARLSSAYWPPMSGCEGSSSVN